MKYCLFYFLKYVTTRFAWIDLELKKYVLGQNGWVPVASYIHQISFLHLELSQRCSKQVYFSVLILTIVL